VSRATHGGGVVFKLTSEGPRYLLVEASGTRDRWVFPKGHVEKRESTAETAQREVSEEAGVRVRSIRRLRRVRQKQEGDWISIEYFLMAYSGRSKPLEKRKVRWLRFDEAFEALDLVRSRRVLRMADRLISLATGGEPMRYRIRRSVTRIIEWLILGAIALLFVAPIPLIATPLALPAGWLVSLAMRVLLRPLEGLASSDDKVPLPAGDDGIRLLIGGSEWMARADYLGGPIRIAAAIAVLLPGAPAGNGWWVALGGLVLAVLLSVFVIKRGRPSRSSAAVFRAPAPWLALGLAANSIVMAGNALEIAAAFMFSVLSAVIWWKLERRRAGVLAAVGGSRAEP
jgi:8-oxo-dGTP pyrophosphatase MutT (NUDIX family)/energy-converting hydrogenase Eha subunit A